MDDLSARIRRLVDEAPPLTEEQRHRLAALLSPVRDSTAPIKERAA